MRKHFIKRSAKLVFSAILYYSGLLSLYMLLRSLLDTKPKPAVLLYHRVLDDSRSEEAIRQPGMCVTSRSFEGQMRYLAKHYRVISFDSLMTLLAEGKPVPHKSVVITFDDGWKDNYDHAYPVLTRYRLPAIIFLCTNMIDTGCLPVFIEISMMLGSPKIWPDKAVEISEKVIHEYHLKEIISELDSERMLLARTSSMQFMVTMMMLGRKHMEIIADEMKKVINHDGQIDNGRLMLNWDEIRAMSQNGIEFGSHGLTHDLLVFLDDYIAKIELGSSKNRIEQQIGKPVNYFSYPNHDFNKKIRGFVIEAGYRGAGAGYTLNDDKAGLDIFAINRYNINEGATVGPMGNFSKTIFALRMARRSS